MTTLARPRDGGAPRGAAVALLTLAIALAGCSTYAASRYVASADTGQALRVYRSTRTVAVGPFVATVPTPPC
jgi:hypothetical protein